MANKNKLSVYLVKEGLFEKEDIFENPDELDILETLSDGFEQLNGHNSLKKLNSEFKAAIST